jgi:hypothetical protein
MKFNCLIVLVLSVFVGIYTLNAFIDSAAHVSEIADVDDKGWLSNEIEFFVLEKLENNNASPTPLRMR